MNLSLVRTLAVLLFAIAGTAAAQQPPQFPTPKAEHGWLEKFVGEWTTESTGTMGPDQPPIQCQGTLSSRKLGGFWVINEMKGNMGGAPMTGVQTIGYDDAKKKYVGTWVDNMMDFMWKYEGSVDKSGKTLTLEADGPNFADPGKMTKFQDIYEFKSKDEMIMTSKMLGADGKWVTFMTGTAKRTK